MVTAARDTGRPRAEVRALSHDALATVALVGTVVFMAVPAFRGDLLAYLDNPVHLTELRGLASGHGWSDAAFGGFPLDVLQPPLLYAGLALLGRAGASLEACYTFMTVLGLLAPALAFYFVARQRAHALGACVLSCTLLFYRGSLVGSAATLAGMFGFHIAAAAWILLLDVFSREARTRRDVALIAVLTAVIGSTHMYVTIALVYLAAIHAAWAVWRGRKRVLVPDFAALAVGALAAAAYWLPNLLARTHVDSQPQAILPIMLKLVTTGAPAVPASAKGLLARLAFDPIHHVDVLPQLFVLLAALAGAALVLRDEDDAPRYGASVAVVMFGLMLVMPFIGVPLLGPQDERLVYIVKVGVLFAALPLLQRATLRFPETGLRWGLTLSALLGVASLSRAVIDHEAIPEASSELSELRSTWSWLREHQGASWGRVYVQDSFDVAGGFALDHSHVLAQTAEQTGVMQLGAYYGNTPYNKSDHWLDLVSAEPATITRDITLMQRANVTHLLLCESNAIDRFSADPRFQVLIRIGRFAVLALKGAVSRWAVQLDSGEDVALRRLEPGHLQLAASGTSSTVAVSESFHPFWRAQPAGVTLSAGQGGFMQVALPSGTAGAVDLRYQRPSGPFWASMLGYLGVLGLVAYAWLGRSKLERAA
jgi:hypothetical protein